LIRVKPDERLLTQDILGHVWFDGERNPSMPTTATITVNTTNVNEDLLFGGNNNHSPMNTSCTNHYYTDQTNKEDAVVPSFECE
jgi:hypothetical protein